MDILKNNEKALSTLCETHNVSELYFFGSVLTDKFNKSSDVDMLIQFAEVDLKHYFENYMDLKEKLEVLFERKVDLVENQAVRNPIFRKVLDREKILVYERKSA
ncbi:nucleotidyltransferase [Lacihabitans sp. CCS-44]|uniref:nucleotidyltransferase family protein n=1 Tax=Lacihabitans sp. CCS-44 TaxID=2487331 RepID=UPI0020CF5761|nr:nucleotidyltransferase domain-containing protein [Lacihabitans sp. CCS-44]MCP9754714.1 nucleotidyltransferase [Lacihabitans sp. CCS-44]